MADYWKSQPRKFCEFCKCWITDNKPSVEFHERGKRHKENVQKRIDELRKRSGEKAQEQEELEAGLAHIEKAALEALKNDLSKDPSLAAQYGVKLKTSGANSNDNKKTEKAATKPEPSESDSTTPAAKVKEWFEAKSPEGYSYYWNVTTNESVWEPPEEYVSLAEQEGLTEQAPDSSGDEAADKAEDNEEEDEEEKEEEEIKEPPAKVFRVDPRGTRGAAYGAWETVRQEPAPEPDPEPEPEPEAAPPALEDIPLPGEIPLPSEIPLPDSTVAPSELESVSLPPVKKDRFKEKTVASLGLSSGGSVGFKKRKIASGARNVRQRDDDD